MGNLLFFVLLQLPHESVYTIENPYCSCEIEAMKILLTLRVMIFVIILQLHLHNEIKLELIKGDCDMGFGNKGMNVELKAVSIFVDILDSLEILIIYSSSNPLNPMKNLTTHPSRPRLLYFCLLKTRDGHLTFLLYIFLQQWLIVFFRKKN